MTAPLTERRRFWRDHLLTCREQGVTLKAYAKQHQLRLAQLYHWSTKLRSLGLLEPSSDPKQAPALIPVRMHAEEVGGEHCRIELPGGERLIWPLAGDTHQLASILSVLESRP